MVTLLVGTERGSSAVVLASLIVFSRFLVVRPALRPQQEAVGHIEESIQDLLSESNHTARLLFDDIFFGSDDSDRKDKEPETSNCSCSQSNINPALPSPQLLVHFLGSLPPPNRRLYTCFNSLRSSDVGY
uniref:Uncharacterized protein n=1 Tax=Lygus hesperus TaxID=30085 RepID=A0A0K8T873_LYGHE